MNDKVLNDIRDQLSKLSRRSTRYRIGEVTDDDPLSVDLGSSGKPYTNVRSIGRVNIGDRVICFLSGNDMFILGVADNGASVPAAIDDYLPEFYVDRYGLVNQPHDTVTDWTSAVVACKEAAINAQGVMVFGRGRYRIDDLEALKIDDSIISIQGQGRGFTILDYTNIPDDEAGYVVDADTVAGYVVRKIGNFKIEGPGGNNYVRGSGNAPCLMDGIRWRSRDLVHDVWAGGLRYVLEANGNHQFAVRVKGDTSHSGVCYPSGAPDGTGDQHYDCCEFSEMARSCIRVEGVDAGGSPPVHDTSFLHTHMGFAPYGIELVGSDHTVPAFQLVSFLECHFEEYGNSLIYGPDRILDGAKFDYCYTGSTGVFRQAGADRKAVVDCYRIYSMVIDGPSFTPHAGTEAVFYGRHILGDIEWRVAADFIYQRLAALTVPVFKCPNGGRRCRITWPDGSAYGAQADQAIVKGDVVHYNSFVTAANYKDGVLAQITKLSSGEGRPAGIAMEAAAGSGAFILVQDQGVAIAKAQGALVEGDPVIHGSSGKVRAAVSGLAEVERINKLPNPSFELGTSHWGLGGVSGGSGLTQITSWSAQGDAAARVEGIGSGASPFQSDEVAASAGQVWAGGIELNVIDNPFQLFLAIVFYNSSMVYLGGEDTDPVAGDVGEIVLTILAEAPASTAHAALQVWSNGVGPLDYYADAAILEVAPAARGYFDGDSPLASWSGTAHDSASEVTQYIYSDYGPQIGISLDAVANGANVPIALRV